MSPAEPPADMGAVARDVDRVERRVDEVSQTLAGVEGQLGGMDAAISDLGETVARLLEVPAARPQAWLLIDDPDVARALLTDLVRWLDAVYLRYADAELPTCWAWHPWVIEELWWLRRAHAEAYSGSGWGQRAGVWHDQQRPGVVRRLLAGVGACDLAQHARGGPKDRAPAAAPLAGHLELIAAAWTSTALSPEPTDAQLADARAYDDAQSRLSMPSS